MSAARRTRIHPSGRPSSRRKVRPPRAARLPFFEAPGDAPLEWSEVVKHAGARPIEVEIGCGKGAFLVAAAARRPSVFFVGVEVGADYARYCADRIARQRLANAVLVADDARLFLADTVPEHALTRLHVYHPDPWPKRRHRKRRVFDADFARLAARGLTPGGELLVATDNTRYFGEILATLGASPALRRSVELEQSYGDEAHGLAFGPTNFSIKYRAEARPRHRAVYTSTLRTTDPQMTDTDTKTWTRIAAVDDIPEAEGLAVEHRGKELALFRDGDRIRCLEDSCPHRGAALSEGSVRDGEVICPWHGWRFGLADGECSTLPGSQAATCFEVKVEGGEVFVNV